MERIMKEEKSPQFDSPNLSEPVQNVLHSSDDLEFGLRGVVRILSGRGKAGRNGYFFEGFKALFASELGEEILFEETFLDYENLKIVIKLPDPLDSTQKDMIRREYLKQYTLGADDLKTRAALVAFAGLDENARRLLIEHEKEWAQKQKDRKDGSK